MRIETETLEEKQKILILSQKSYPFIDLLKAELRNYGAEVFFSSQIPPTLKKFDYCFFINGRKSFTEEIYLPKSKLIYLNYNQTYNVKGTSDKVKTVNLLGDVVSKEIIDKILWFSFSESKEKIVNFRLIKQKQVKKEIQVFPINKFFDLKSLIWIGILIFLLANLSFLMPLSFASYFSYRSFKSFDKGDSLKTKKYLLEAQSHLKTAKKLYSFSRPVFLFFSVAILPDNILDIVEKSAATLNNSYSVLENAKILTKLVMQKNEIAGKKELISSRIRVLSRQLKTLETDLSTLNQELPTKTRLLKSIKSKLNEALEYVSKSNQLVSQAEDFLGQNDEKTYLLLFANDMELRPGGGFIGSFGLIKFKDLSLKELKIYDVYDADGQLEGHIDPPAPIRNYLNQPHWFLRDSAFSPDFLENYSQAKYFLQKEMGMDNFSGCILLTTSSVKNLLSAFGNILIPDYNEIVNDQNFYLKAQLYSEKNFFPGSIQKKSFLGSLTKSILLNLENASIRTLISGFKKNLDEKKMAVYSDNPKIQRVLDSFYWSGRLIEPACPRSVGNCINDFIFPVDANLGVNKANFFINRLISLKILLQNQKAIKHYLSIQFKNDSPSEVFPGGNYKNYFQVYLPRDVVVKTITRDGTLVENYDEKITGEFKIIGFLIEVKVKKSTEIKINYDLPRELFKDDNIYQLIFQKQLGSSNSDLMLEFDLDKHIRPINQNFSPLVKDNQILYNTNLSADKIFILEFNNN